MTRVKDFTNRLRKHGFCWKPARGSYPRGIGSTYLDVMIPGDDETIIVRLSDHPANNHRWDTPDVDSYQQIEWGKDGCHSGREMQLEDVWNQFLNVLIKKMNEEGR